MVYTRLRAASYHAPRQGREPMNSMTDAELVEQLRRAASIWFKNEDLLMLEELLRRYARVQAKVNAMRLETLR